MMNNKKGVGMVGMIFLFLFFVIIWFAWLSQWINTAGQYMIETNDLGGIEAFFYANLNLWVLIAVILGLIGFMYFGAAAR